MEDIQDWLDGDTGRVVNFEWDAVSELWYVGVSTTSGNASSWEPTLTQAVKRALHMIEVA